MFVSALMAHCSVLDDFDEVRVVIACSHKGKILEDFPDVFDELRVVYETLPGWKQSIAAMGSYDDLPLNAGKYIEFIEQFVSEGLIQVKIKYTGTGKVEFFCGCCDPTKA